jgi:cytochrome c oxidase subunit 4
MNRTTKAHALVWAALMALLLATFGLSRVDFKGFNVAIALVIALAKMLLIFAYFMELRASKRSLWVVASVGFIWLIILFDLTLSDYLTRGYSWSQ